VLEIVGGLLVFIISPALVQNVAAYFTAEELGQDPHDFIAASVLHWANVYATGPHQLFIALYLLVHGIVKAGLVIGLLRGRLWAYPASLIIFGLLIVYQLYLFILGQSLAVAALTFFDFVVVYLIWREYGIIKAHQARNA